MKNLPQDWWEVRVLTTDRQNMPRWMYCAGPFTEEAAHDFVDTSGILGRTMAVVRCSVWAEVTL